MKYILLVSIFCAGCASTSLPKYQSVIEYDMTRNLIHQSDYKAVSFSKPDSVFETYAESKLHFDRMDSINKMKLEFVELYDADKDGSGIAPQMDSVFYRDKHQTGFVPEFICFRVIHSYTLAGQLKTDTFYLNKNLDSVIAVK